MPEESEDEEKQRTVQPISAPKRRKAAVSVGKDEDSDDDEYPAQEIDLESTAGPRSPRRPRRSSVCKKPQYIEISDDEVEDDAKSDSDGAGEDDEDGNDSKQSARAQKPAAMRKPAQAKLASANKTKPKPQPKLQPAPARKKPSKNVTGSAAAAGRGSAGKRKGRADGSDEEDIFGFNFEKAAEAPPAKKPMNTLDAFFQKKPKDNQA